MDGPINVQSHRGKSRRPVEKHFSESSLSPMMALLQSQKELCTISTEELTKEQECFNEVTFLCFANDRAVFPKELATVSEDLPVALNSFHSCSSQKQEVIFLKDCKCNPGESSSDFQQKNYPLRILCVMRLSSSFPRLRVDTVFALLSKYMAAIRCIVEMCSLQKHTSDSTHSENDDTNQSVSSIEDDFVTALEHLDEDEPAKVIHSEHVTFEISQGASPQTLFIPNIKSTDQKSTVSSLYQKPSVKSSVSLVNILEIKELTSSVRNSVSTSISEPWIQRNVFRSHNSSDYSVNVWHKTLFSSSSAESSESDCSTPSPVIFLDEEGYQKSLKAKLQLPKIPVVKDGVEDSDSEVSEFFDSFDQFDEDEQTLENSSKPSREPVVSHSSQKNIFLCKKSCSAISSMNPQKFKSNHSVLPANVKKPTPRKPESPYNNLLDVPDSPRLIKTSADHHRDLFSPIRSSAFSPLGSCFSTEFLCQTNQDAVNHNHNLVYHTYSDFANNISFEILGSVCNSSAMPLCSRGTQEVCNSNRVASKEEKDQVAKIRGEVSRNGLGKNDKSRHKSVMIKDHLQKFASELVEKSFGSAFKDLQKGVSSCTNALCHLAAKLTSSIFQMAFCEIGRRQALSLKKRALNGLAGFLVSDAITGALKELRAVKQQIFTNTVARFAANLTEELMFEGMMEVCQFSYPSTPTQPSSFHYDDKVVRSYAKDLSDSVIQEAFIELSQADVTFTSQAAISISVDNIQCVSSETMVESAQSSGACNKESAALNPIWEFRKEYTVHKALFYTSGIASSIPVPLTGSLFSPNQNFGNDVTVKSCLTSDGKFKLFRESTEVSCATNKMQGKISVQNIYLTTDFTPGNEHKPSDRPDASIFSEMSSINNFSGTMVDLIVTEAYEAVTSSKVSKSLEQYTDMLKLKKTPILQCIGEDSCKNTFANYLAKSIVKQSVDEAKSACSATSEKLPYGVDLGPTKRIQMKELHKVVDQSEKNKTIPIVVGQPQMPLKNLSKYHVTPIYSHRCLLGSKNSLKGKKKQGTYKSTTYTFSPCVVSCAKHNEQFPDPEGCSAISTNNSFEKQSLYKATGHSSFSHERSFFDMNISPVMPQGEDAFHLEDKLNLRERNLCIVPETPPSTPLIPSQVSYEWSLRKLTKKLKGVLAKEFAPAPPPSTPYRSEVGRTCDTLEKEAFVLELIRSLSEEVENSEAEEDPKTLTESVQQSGTTVVYADHLAAHIISMATEMAAFHLEDRATQMENNKYFQVSLENKRCGCTASVSENKMHPLWLYASEVAGKVIREAKKRVKSRNCELSQANYEGRHFNLKRNYEYWSEAKKPLAEENPKERNCFILSLPQSSEVAGLYPKYPSCDSVTEEYADHIIRILKRGGGYGDLPMDHFASRLAYKSIMSGVRQAARKLRVKYTRKLTPETANQDVGSNQQKIDTIYQFGKRSCKNRYHLPRTERAKLLEFSESLACSIASDARKKVTSTASLPKSLTDSCLYKGSKADEATGFRATLAKRLPPSCCKQKLYHSTSSLNEYTYRGNILHAIDHYAKKIVDDTLEASLELTIPQAADNWTNGERSVYAEKQGPFSVAACRFCSIQEHQYFFGRTPPQLSKQELSSEVPQMSHLNVNNILPKSHVLHLDIPEIHIDMDKKAVLGENVVATTFGRAGRQLSNTSLAADSGIGQDGISFADSLTTEIMTSCMSGIAPAINISSMEEEELNSAESIVSQQMNLSLGDDSTGSWSNLSFDDEQPDENSSFFHISDSHGNTSSCSSLGLEGDMYEENLSFSTSDSDGIEDNKEELKDTIEELRNPRNALVVVNVDVGPCVVDPQLRWTLQWLTASDADVAELYFHGRAPVEFVLLSKTLQERGWKVGDLFRAVLKYCEAMEKSADDGDQTLENKTLFRWLQEHV